MNTEKTGAFITELRKEKELTQAQLAEILHVSDKAVSKWETGRGLPDLGSLEDLSDYFQISIAELLKGERFSAVLPAEEVSRLTDDSLSLMKELISRRAVRNILLGFLCGALLLTLAVVHLNSPVYLPYAEAPAEIKILDDGRIAAVLDEKADGCSVERVRDPESGENAVFLGSYKTRFRELSGKKEANVVILGKKGEIAAVYSYPGDPQNGDVLLYEDGYHSPAGVVTLPRLVYGYWIALSLAASAAVFVLYAVLRRKYYAPLLFRAAVLPLCFAFSAVLVLFGKFDRVYNAAYYLSGIGLLTVLLFAVFLLLTSGRKRGS